MAKYTLPPGEKGQFAVIPEGVYRMQIQSPRIAYAKGSGGPTIECYLAVLEGAFSGERIYHQYSLQSDALWRIRDDLRTTGRLPRDKFPTDQPVNLEDTDMVKLLDGANGWASIFTDSYKGAPRSKLATAGFLTPEELSQRGTTVTTQAPTPQRVTVPPPANQPQTQYPEASEPF